MKQPTQAEVAYLCMQAQDHANNPFGSTQPSAIDEITTAYQNLGDGRKIEIVKAFGRFAKLAGTVDKCTRIRRNSR